jgi:hypothetical protein
MPLLLNSSNALGKEYGIFGRRLVGPISEKVYAHAYLSVEGVFIFV